MPRADRVAGVLDELLLGLLEALGFARLACMESHFRLNARADDDARVLTLGGELDLAASPALEEELDKALGSNVSLVLVDLRQLDFMDSTGLSALVRAHQRAEQTGQRFVLVNGSRQVQRLLSLTGIAERMTLVDDPDEALRGS